MKHGRTDANQTAIIDTLRKMGCKVHITSDLAGGFPDCICAIGKNLIMIEIKDGSKPPSGRRLTPLEQKFHNDWHGHVVIISSVDEAIELVLEMRL